MTKAVWNHYTLPCCTNAVMLMAVGLLALAAWKPVGNPPVAPVSEAKVLTLRLDRQQGFAPLKVIATVHQDVEAVTDREVCLHVEGTGEPQLSCWRIGSPTPIVIRELRITEGTYEIYAQVGTVHSNHLTVVALGQ
jgi:hypothetical protein